MFAHARAHVYIRSVRSCRQVLAPWIRLLDLFLAPWPARTPPPRRCVPQPFEFVAGTAVSAAAAKKISEGAGGLFAGGSGPKPPPALSNAVIGMKAGGKVRVLAVRAAAPRACLPPSGLGPCAVPPAVLHTSRGPPPHPPAAAALPPPSLQRLVRVDVADLGYPDGNQEIPKGGAFELRIEVLAAVKKGAAGAV